MTKTLNSRIPEGPVAEKWTNYKAHQRLVNPKNKLKLDVIVVGTGLAGARAAASLGEMGFNVLNFCIQDSPRRAHSIAGKEVLTQQRTIRTTATLFIVSFTIPLRAEITVLARPTFIV